MNARFTHAVLCRPRTRRCRVIARGALDSVAVQLDTGGVVIANRGAVGRLRNQAVPRQLERLRRLGARIDRDDDDILFIGFLRGAIPWVESLESLTYAQASALISCLESRGTLEIDTVEPDAQA